MTELRKKRVNEILPQIIEDDLFSGFFNKSSESFAVNIKEENEKYIVTAALPGIKKDEIELILFSEKLSINISQKEEKTEKEEYYLKREISSKKTTRTFNLPQSINENVTAELKDGILTIIIPKHNQTENNRIEIK